MIHLTSLVVLGFLLGSVGPATAQGTIPRGIVSLTAGGTPIADAILADARILGVTIRSSWLDTEPRPGAYDFSYFRTQLDRVRSQWVLLRNVSGGRNVPAWALAKMATLQYEKDGVTHTMAVPWDPVLLDYKRAVIRELGRAFAGHPRVRVVSSSCANTHTDDWGINQADAGDLRNAGYTKSKLIAACKRIIRDTMNAFPTQAVLMAVGRMPRELGADQDEVARTIVDWARSTYPGRFVTQKNSLSARTPDPTVTSNLGAWRIVHDAAPEVGGQMLWAATGDPDCRMNGGEAPCDPVAVLSDAIATGIAYEMLYLEVYQRDLLNPDPAMQDVITEAAAALAP